MAAWREMGLPAPVRWIDASDLGRAGGWPTDWEQLQWNLLRVRSSEIGSLPNRSGSDDMQTHTNRSDRWTEAIRPRLDQLLGTADVYDRLKRHDEPEVLEVHHEINSHGIGLDVELAHAVPSGTENDASAIQLTSAHALLIVLFASRQVRNRNL